MPTVKPPVASLAALAKPLSSAQLLRMSASSYMNEAQLSFFRQLLQDLRRQTSDHIESIKQEIAAPLQEADVLDRALWEEENR